MVKIRLCAPYVANLATLLGLHEHVHSGQRSSSAEGDLCAYLIGFILSWLSAILSSQLILPIQHPVASLNCALVISMARGGERSKFIIVSPLARGGKL